MYAYINDYDVRAHTYIHTYIHTYMNDNDERAHTYIHACIHSIAYSILILLNQ